MGSNNQKGFTLIELVVVIVILGILAATALPKFIDMSGQATQAAVQGVAGALSSGSAVNYAAKKAGNSSAVTGVGCTTASANQLLQGGLPSGYSVSGSTTIAPDITATCTVSSGTTTAAAYVTGT